jgi:hypothetical protein
VKHETLCHSISRRFVAALYNLNPQIKVTCWRGEPLGENFFFWGGGKSQLTDSSDGVIIHLGVAVSIEI